MKITLLALLFMISAACFCQSKQYLYYFDKDLNSAPKAKAVLKGVGAYSANLFEIKVYSISNNNLLWSQHFIDSSLQVSDGMYQFFYPGGAPESAGNYLKNYEDGLWQKWDSSGHNIDSSFYDKGTLARYIHRGYYKSGFPDSIIMYNSKTDELVKTFYNDSGFISSRLFSPGKRGWKNFTLKVFLPALILFTAGKKLKHLFQMARPHGPGLS